MKWPLKIFDFYVNASIHVGLAVISFLLISVYTLNISVTNSLLCFVFFSTILAYNFLKYGMNLRENLNNRGKEFTWIVILSIFSLIAVSFSVFALPSQIIPLMSLLLLLLILYIVPVFPRDRNLRSLGLLKVIIVAISWTGFTVFLPVLADEAVLSWDAWILSLQRFLIILAMMIPFEIRDMYLDPPGINTLPRKYGVTRTKQIGVFLAVFSLILIYFKDEMNSVAIGVRCVMTIVLCILIIRTPEYPSKYYASFWVEGLPIPWLLLLFTGTIW